MIEVSIDWLASSRSDRQALYRAIKRALDESGSTWRDLYRDALDQPYAPGQGYEDNFRAGRISRKKAHRLYSWLRDRHPARATELDTALTGAAPLPAGDWERFLEAHGQEGRLSIVTLDDPTIGIVAFATTDPVKIPRVRLRQPFCFRLECPIAGEAVALQQVGGGWFPLPLSPNSLHAAVTRGPQYLPRAPGRDAPIGLSEDTHIGMHRFALLIDSPVVAALCAELTIGEAVPVTTLHNAVRQFSAKVDGIAVLTASAVFTA